MRKKTFSGGMQDLEDIGKFVSHAARQADLNETDIYALELAVDEACTNIIEHGYHSRGDQTIVCSCSQTALGIKITLQDASFPFDPRSIPDPARGKKLEELQTRGVGVFLMRHLLDGIDYRYDPVKGNVLTLVKHRSAR